MSVIVIQVHVNKTSRKTKSIQFKSFCFYITDWYI